MNDKLRFQRHADGVAVLTINRPEAHNALDLETMRALADHIAQLAADPNLRAVVLTGAGEQSFCSGGDLVELSRYPAAEDAQNMITLMGNALLALERLPVPVIAAINGYALGGGSEVALACDLRIADEKARMGFVQMRMALTPGWGAGQRLLRTVGYSRALDLLLSSHILHAPELLSMGLVNRVVEAGTALTHALNTARHIATSPPDVVRAAKALLQAGLLRPYDEALRFEREVFPALWADEPHLLAVERFLNRSKETST
jgi:enoyl-CoA hydratase